MTPYYALNNIPYDVEPFKSVAGNDYCTYPSYPWIIDNSDQYQYGFKGYDHGTHLSGYNSIVIKRPNITTKEYIELLYSIRNIKINAQIGFSAESFAQDNHSWNVGFDANLYPVLASDHTSYIAPSTRCLINNRINKGQVNAWEHTLFNFGNITNAVEGNNPYASSNYQDHFNFGNWGRVFPQLVDIYQTDYVTNVGYIDYADDKTPFGFLGKGLQFNLPTFNHYNYYEKYGGHWYQNTTIRLSDPFTNIEEHLQNDVGGFLSFANFVFEGETYEFFVTFHGTYYSPTASSTVNMTIEVEHFNFLNE